MIMIKEVYQKKYSKIKIQKTTISMNSIQLFKILIVVFFNKIV